MNHDGFLLVTTFFLLLCAMQVKHLMADYFLQNGYMLRKFLPDWGFALPLLCHALVHGAFTLVVVLVINPSFWWLSLVDVVAHFVMDRAKAGPKYLGRFKALTAKQYISNKLALEDAEASGEKDVVSQCKKRMNGNTYFWWSLGLDQMVHHLTDLAIVYVLVIGS